MSEHQCVLPHKHEPERPRKPVDGLYICAGCLSRLEQTIAEMPAHYEQLAGRLATGKTVGDVVTGTSNHPLPIDERVADHRKDIRGKLASWGAMIAEERGINPPPSELNALAGWLLVHLRWACAQPWLDEYAAELRALRGMSMAILLPSGRKRINLGPCVEEECEGKLTAILEPKDQDKGLFPSQISCDIDPEHSWDARHWPSLGRRMSGAPGLIGEDGVNRLIDIIRRSA